MNNLLFLNLGTPEMTLICFTLILTALACLIDIIRSDFKDSATKLIWLLAVLFIPLIGWVLYLLIGRKQRVLTS